jgi:radical SAM superfamily enzyme YgiQ (UPF0313 family)
MSLMRLTLVDNLLYESSYSVRRDDLQPHLGLMSLAAVVRRAGHRPTIYDPKWEVFTGRLTLDSKLYDRLAADILRTLPEAVGFTALGCNFPCVVNVAGRLKKIAPELPILLGGPHATILHHEILTQFSEFDVIVRNEAEPTINPVLSALDDRNFSNLSGISYRNRCGEIVCNPGSPLIDDLDELPIPAYDCYPIDQLGLKSIRVEAGRGCPFSCTFCSTASFFGRSYRLKSTGRLLDELDYVHEIWGYTDFKLNHDLFTVNRKRVVEFCEAMKARCYTWSCSARIDCVDPPLLALMQRAGCRNIYFGIETASPRLQELSRKRMDIELVAPILEVTARLGIETTTSFITGYPEEMPEDQDQTLDMAGRLLCFAGGKNVSQIHLLTPEPGTDLIARYSDKLLFDGHVSEFNFPMLRADDQRLLSQYPILFSNHHYFPTPIARKRNIFVTSAWIVLWETGRVIVGYMLRGFEGRLSRFMTEAWNWRRLSPRKSAKVGADDIEGFLQARFGRQNHLVSLFRYARALSDVGKRRTVCPSGTMPAAVDPRDEPLRIKPGTILLRDIHNCVTLLNRIEKSASQGCIFDDAEAGGLGHLLLAVEPASTLDAAMADIMVRSHWLDDATADLLARFKDPKSYWMCCKEIADRDDHAPFPEWNDLVSLWEMGILEYFDQKEASRHRIMALS